MSVSELPRHLNSRFGLILTDFKKLSHSITSSGLLLQALAALCEFISYTAASCDNSLLHQTLHRTQRLSMFMWLSWNRGTIEPLLTRVHSEQMKHDYLQGTLCKMALIRAPKTSGLEWVSFTPLQGQFLPRVESCRPF
ncbi:hypothetical protein CPB83DRAFT_850958 [Crepidotus variabilis]|uniref:Uncharacterized protein n=1 Tax=Crepidotus variabilis TaxID=179855 RepID=A0A9P6EKF5_9AGAR|nr:hypothetical protein CPB83DRAFT_850958 [Crepidotus variabilis]